MSNAQLIIREGRACDYREVLNQIGKMNVFAVSGGRVWVIFNSDDEPIGVALPIDGTRRVEVVLDYSDTYTVRRMRKVVNGKNRGTEVTEYERSDVYCEQVGEVTYQASCWK